MARKKSYSDITRQYRRIESGLSVDSKRLAKANRAYTKYAVNMSKIGGSSNTKFSRSQYMGRANSNG